MKCFIIWLRIILSYLLQNFRSTSHWNAFGQGVCRCTYWMYINCQLWWRIWNHEVYNTNDRNYVSNLHETFHRFHTIVLSYMGGNFIASCILGGLSKCCILTDFLSHNWYYRILYIQKFSSFYVMLSFIDSLSTKVFR